MAFGFSDTLRRRKRGESPPPKSPPFDMDRALSVMLRPHPSLEKHRAANGELVLIVQRELHPVEKFMARLFPIRRERRIVLDKYGEFMLETACRPETRLADVAAAMARKFEIDPEKARHGVVQLVRELLIRGFVFLIQEPPPGAGTASGKTKSADPRG